MYDSNKDQVGPLKEGGPLLLLPTAETEGLTEDIPRTEDGLHHQVETSFIKEGGHLNGTKGPLHHPGEVPLPGMEIPLQIVKPVGPVGNRDIFTEIVYNLTIGPTTKLQKGKL